MKLWFSRKKKSGDAPVIDDDKVMLHGHNLSRWNYLGYTCCRWGDEKGNITSEHYIFLFVDKDNDKKRSYCIPGKNAKYLEENHGYVLRSLKPWVAGEGEIWHLITGNGNLPSDYLKKYMLDRFGSEWDTETNWWTSSESARYNAAIKQNNERNSKEVKSDADSNVVTVDFGKPT